MKFFKKFFARDTKESKPGARSYQFSTNRSAGVYVDESTALTYSPIWRCVNLISQSIGALPWAINERSVNSDGRRETTPLLNHPAAMLLDFMANPEMSSQAWRETMIAWALTWGNGYSEIERDRANRPIALWPIEPNRVTPTRDGEGKLVFVITNETGPNTILYPENMFHLHGLGFDGLVGYSVIQMAARGIGLGIATEQFGGDFFGNGAHVGGVFSHPNTLGDESIKHLKASIKERQGGKNALSPMVLEEGMTYAATSIPPDDAQFIETRKFNIGEIARWYGVPLHKLHEMDKSSFNNIEHQSIEYVQDALIPWIRRAEIEANIKLILPQNFGRVSTKLNLNSLLRGDLKTRGEWYKTMSNLGVFSPNDILELEDRNTIGPDGDKRLVQLNQTTLERIGTENVDNQTPVPGAQDEEEGAENNNEPDNVAELRAIMVRAMDRCIVREDHRATDALKRYSDDRDGLFAWMDNFYDQHKQYFNDAIYPPLDSLKMTPAPDLDGFINNYIAASRLLILAAFDGDIELNLNSAENSVIELLESGL